MKAAAAKAMTKGAIAEALATSCELKNKEFAENIIAGCHESWKKLASHETDGKGIVLTNTTLNNGDSVNAGDAAALVAGQAEPGEELPLPETVDKWHYVSLK